MDKWTTGAENEIVATRVYMFSGRMKSQTTTNASTENTIKEKYPHNNHDNHNNNNKQPSDPSRYHITLTYQYSSLF
jgi:hypothetical protein